MDNQSSREATGRPTRLTSLFHGGAPYAGWEAANWKALRFYLVNVPFVIGQLRLEHTSSGNYFAQAAQVIENETDWPQQFKADYRTSRTQIYPKAVGEPKLLAKAATSIVALELAAKDKDPGFNVYDYLRILPAYYFIDLFDERILASAEKKYADNWTEEGPRDFASYIVHKVQQRDPRLLIELASGFCVTEEVARRMQIALSPWCDEEIGPVRPAGDARTVSARLGTRSAAKGLLTPLRVPLEGLSPL